jgi:hypothetical protein
MRENSKTPLTRCGKGSKQILKDKYTDSCYLKEIFNDKRNLFLLKFVQSNITSCNCDNNDDIDRTLLNTENCEKEDKVLCQQQVCVVYRRGK